VPANVGFIFALLTFAAGFAVRPFGALIFGHFGDLIGRKYTFLVTMTLMGIGTYFSAYSRASLLGASWRRSC
jgi:MFS family permease